jgi:predicted DNA-binding ArsR family transcriptional regulator
MPEDDEDVQGMIETQGKVDELQDLADSLHEQNLPIAYAILQRIIDVMKAKFQSIDDTLKIYEQELAIMAQDESSPSKVIHDLEAKIKDTRQMVLEDKERRLKIGNIIETSLTKHDDMIKSLRVCIEDINARIGDIQLKGEREDFILRELDSHEERLDLMGEQIKVLQPKLFKRKEIESHIEKPILPPKSTPILYGVKGEPYTSEAISIVRKHLPSLGYKKYKFIKIASDNPVLMIDDKKYYGLRRIKDRLEGDE